jgi:hypothetical protein
MTVERDADSARVRRAAARIGMADARTLPAANSRERV